MAVSLSIKITQDSQNITHNYSNITVDVTASWTNGSNNRTSPAPKGALKVNGVSYAFSSTFNDLQTNSGSQLLFRKSVTVYHNTDGSKTVSASASFDTGVSSGIISASTSKTLTRIPRAATLTSAPNFNDEANPKIAYNNPAGSAATTLQAAIYNSDGSTAYASYRDISKSGTEYTFSLTAAERTALRNAAKNAKSITVKFYVKTVIGSETYYSSLAKTLSIVNANPTVNPTITDTNSVTTGLTGDSNKLVRYYSNAKVTFGASALKGASISSRKVECGSKSLSADGTINAVESGAFKFTVTDSRGNTTTKTVNQSIVNYIKLTCGLANTEFTTDGVISFTVKGNYFSGSFGTVSNTLTVQYRYKLVDGSYSDWTATQATVSSNTYSANITISGLDYQQHYVIQARAIDKLITIASSAKTMSCVPVFDWSADDFNFNVPVNFNAGFTNDNKVLWSGGYYMTAGQTATLNEPVSAQASGIVLIFSRYDIANGSSLNEHFSYHFVPKQIINLHEGKGSVFNMATSNNSYYASKYLYIYDTYIDGHDNNGEIGTGTTGITYNNNRFVLRYVIGV